VQVLEFGRPGAGSTHACACARNIAHGMPWTRLESRYDVEARTAVDSLPRLPDQDVATMRSEACCGNCVVLGIIFMCVMPVHGSSSEDALPWKIAIYTEALIALVCLLGLMWGDPGTLKRSPEACFPQPAVVAEALQRGDVRSLSTMQNVRENGATFCVRCLIWRPDETVHHCSTCQRCVRDFDHHCGVFGRCIAGQSMRTVAQTQRVARRC
jgi:hypothetical protein